MKTLAKLHPSVRSKAATFLSVIRRSLTRPCVQQVWLFGSACQRQKIRPGDIDVALICNDTDFHQVATVLAEEFPDCAIDRGDYTRTERPPNEFDFHFLLASPAMLRQAPRLLKSIKSGMRLQN